MTSSKKKVGDILRSAREARELSQAALAKKSAVSKQTIIKIETNQRSPSHGVLCRLVHALDISADLIVRPDRTIYTMEQEQFIRELLSCSEREQRIVRTLLRALREDAPKKQD